MRIPAKTWMTWTGAAFSALLLACATTQPPQELEQARADYEQLEESRTAEAAPAALEEAEEALEQAEESFEEHGDSEVARQRARDALRKIHMARESGEVARGMEQGQELERAAGTPEAETEQRRIQAERDLRQVRQRLEGVADVRQDRNGLVLWFGEDLFEGEENTLTSSAKDDLRQTATALQQMQDRDIRVVAYTGVDTPNRDLWNQRAQAVQTHLTQQGVARDRVQAEVRAEQAPRAMETGEEMKEGAEEMKKGAEETKETRAKQRQARTGIAIVVQHPRAEQREGTPSYERGMEPDKKMKEMKDEHEREYEEEQWEQEEQP
ncbi:MAG: OmpA family protein [Myxococcota bacterium]